MAALDKCIEYLNNPEGHLLERSRSTTLMLIFTQSLKAAKNAKLRHRNLYVAHLTDRTKYITKMLFSIKKTVILLHAHCEYTKDIIIL